MLLLLASLASAADLWVGTADYPTFADAFEATTRGDRILVPPGTWVTGFSVITSDLTIEGVGNRAEIVLISDGLSQSNSMLRVNNGATVTVKNLTLDGDRYATPLAVYEAASATVEGVHFIRGDEPLSFGGGGCLDIWEDADVTVRNSIFEDCTAGERGGAIEVSSADLTLENSRVLDSSSANWGGGIYCGGARCNIDGTLFSGNRSDRGAGLYAHDGPSDVRRSVFCDNYADVDGAGAWLSNASHILRNSVFWNNQSVGNGAAWRADDSSNDIGVYRVEGQHNLYGYNNAGSGGVIHLWDMQYDSYGDIYTNHSTTAAFASNGIGTSSRVTLDHVVDFNNDTLTNGTATNVITSDPMLSNPTETGCSLADWTLDSGSPAIDAGPELDPDGTAGDLGVFGGPDAIQDGDGDGSVAPWDCNDGDGDIGPTGTETCNGVDDDCDFAIDEGLSTTSWYADGDGDGHGSGSPIALCDGSGTGLVALGDDCDDADAAFSPSAAELCDGLDNDCDGTVDEGLTQSDFFADGDADGYGTGAAFSACAAPPGYVALDGDCNDGNTAYNPGATESDCTDPNDYNCDGSVQYVDSDGDGYAACEECDDSESSINPGADETCDGVDEDCDGTVDEEAIDRIELAQDEDRDGYGNAAVLELQCDGTSGWVDDRADCDDSNPAIHPDAAEIEANGIDENCDGVDDQVMESTGCGCDASTGASGLWWLGLAAVGIRRRRE